MDPALINTEKELEIVGEGPVSFSEGNRSPGRSRDFSIDIVAIEHMLRSGSLTEPFEYSRASLQACGKGIA